MTGREADQGVRLPRVVACAFALARASADAARRAGFANVEDRSSFCPHVTRLKNRRITIDCKATQYCPGVETAPFTIR